VTVNYKIDGQSIKHILWNVLHVPKPPNCLISIPHLAIGGGWVEFKGNGCQLSDKNSRIIGKGKLTNMLYLLNACAELPNRESSQYASIWTHSWDQWHRLYGHISVHISVNATKSLKLNQMVDGLKIDDSTFPSESCKACIQAKQAHKPFLQEAKNQSKVPGEHIMSDVWGLAQTESIGQWKYYISFTDDGVHLTAVLFLKNKGQAFSRIKEYVAVIKQKFGKPPKFM